MRTTACELYFGLPKPNAIVTPKSLNAPKFEIV